MDFLRSLLGVCARAIGRPPGPGGALASVPELDPTRTPAYTVTLANGEEWPVYLPESRPDV